MGAFSIWLAFKAMKLGRILGGMSVHRREEVPRLSPEALPTFGG